MQINDLTFFAFLLLKVKMNSKNKCLWAYGLSCVNWWFIFLNLILFTSDYSATKGNWRVFKWTNSLSSDPLLSPKDLEHPYQGSVCIWFWYRFLCCNNTHFLKASWVQHGAKEKVFGARRPGGEFQRTKKSYFTSPSLSFSIYKKEIIRKHSTQYCCKE